MPKRVIYDYKEIDRLMSEEWRTIREIERMWGVKSAVLSKWLKKNCNEKISVKYTLKEDFLNSKRRVLYDYEEVGRLISEEGQTLRGIERMWEIKHAVLIKWLGSNCDKKVLVKHTLKKELKKKKRFSAVPSEEPANSETAPPTTP
jgi:hypothetical protein